MNLITEVIGFGMSTIFILLLLAKIIWKNIRSGGGAESAAVVLSEAQIMMSDSETDDSSINGLKPVVIASLPTMEFNDSVGSRDDLQCSICLGEYKDKEVLLKLPRCGHSFHHRCIYLWLQKQSTCPVCRSSLHDSSKAKHMLSPTFSTDV